MCDFLKEIFQAAQQRIRSPFIGLVIFAFIAVNWQALYFLFFAEVSVLARITYFNTKTSLGSLYGLPLLIGGIMALVLPFIRVGFVCCIRFANRWLHQLQAGEAILREINELELAVKKTKAEADLAVARAKGQARVQDVEVQNRIEAAKRDVEAKVEVKDERISERLQEEIQQVRDPHFQTFNRLTVEAKRILQVARDQGRIVYMKLMDGERIFSDTVSIEGSEMSHREWTEYLAGLETLEQEKLLRAVNSKRETFEMTAAGYKVAEYLGQSK